MEFDPGFDIDVDRERMDFVYGDGVFGPPVERRRLDDIRGSLLDPACDGPEVPYVVAMDVGRTVDRADLIKRGLLFGVMIYAKGTLGREPVRSQGHVHAVSPSCGCSTPEVYEVWDGEAIILMQEHASDDPGRCYAVHANAGEVVIVPPAWAHCTINADPAREMVFGAWCIRDYGFDYGGVRSHKGLAFYPELDEGSLRWVHNDRYASAHLIEREARRYPEFFLRPGMALYPQYERGRSLFGFVTNPQVNDSIWNTYEP